MKIFLIAFILCPLFAYGAEYGGANKYPVQTKTGGIYVLVVDSVDISPSYDLQARAESAAIALSLKCGCEVSIKQPVLKYRTEWRNTSSSSSAKSSSSSSSAASSSSSSRIATSGYIEWQAPTQREDGSPLESVAAYHVVFEEKQILVAGDKTKLALNKTSGVALIAAQDSTGVMSNYAQANVKAVF